MENRKSKLGIGVDTGDAFTDAVLMNLEKGKILRTTKVQTTHEALSKGLFESIDGVLEGVDPREVSLVAVSTTLATNAIVEGKGGDVGLLLLGWDLEENRDLPTDHIVGIGGRFNPRGEEEETLDLTGLKSAINEMQSRVDAFAISGYFSVRNPAHELKVKEVIQSKTGLPVVCGHELTGKLGVYERTVTAVLNAQILPLITSFFDSVEKALKERKINAPLMIVKSDGSIVNVEEAREHPVETVLSGPAASAIGGSWLSGLKEGVVIDIGSTTTDIMTLHNGLPNLEEEGATVGKWKTRVKALDTRSIGLGGDSRVSIPNLGSTSKIQIGPRKVVPLAFSTLDERAAQIMEDFQEVEFIGSSGSNTALKNISGKENKSKILSFIHNEKVNIGRLRTWAKELGIYGLSQTITRFEKKGVIKQIGFTPTDALHVLGEYREGKTNLSEAGAKILGKKLGMDAGRFSKLVKEKFEEKVTREIIKKLILEEKADIKFDENPLWWYLINGKTTFLNPRFKLGVPVVGIGAPAHCLLPKAVETLGSELLQVKHFAVGNAVGAITGSVVKKFQVLVIEDHLEERFLIFLPSKRVVLDTDDEEQAMGYALKNIRKIAEAEMAKLGAKDANLRIQEKKFKFGRGKITILAVGKPLIQTHSKFNDQ